MFELSLFVLLTLPGVEPNQAQSSRSAILTRLGGSGLGFHSREGNRELEPEDACFNAPPPLTHLLSDFRQVAPHLWAQFSHP